VYPDNCTEVGPKEAVLHKYLQPLFKVLGRVIKRINYHQMSPGRLGKRGGGVMYRVICMMLLQYQGAFIKCFVILSELGALGLLFLILNPTTMWMIHLNIAERKERELQSRMPICRVLKPQHSDTLYCKS